MWRIFIAVAILAVALSANHLDGESSLRKRKPHVPEAKLEAAPYHIWAHLHWVWLHADEVNQNSAPDLVHGYKSRDIPVGATNIDSSWMTSFNSFNPNTDKWPDMGKFISDMHDESVRVLFWATSFVNTDDPDYEFAKDKGYLVRNHLGFVRPLHWWHGDGGLIDFSNPEAMTWWKARMDIILNMGADGFKCDGSDPYIDEYIALGGALGYNDTSLTYTDYSHGYYGTFFDHTREVRGDAGLIMSRPIDCFMDKITRFCLPFSQKEVVLSGWPGDDDPTFDGLRGCVTKNIYSAWAGYPGFGCDIGGYRGNHGDGTPHREVFIRWAQMGAFVPLMENGGAGEHRPWLVDCPGGETLSCDEGTTVAIYRKFVLEHHRLAPWLLTLGSAARASGESIIRPLATNKPDLPPGPLPYRRALKADQPLGLGGDHKFVPDWFKITFPQPDSFSYTLGSDLMVVPVVAGRQRDLEDTGDLVGEDGSLPEKDRGFAVVKAQWPAGADWVDYWAPSNGKKLRLGGSSARLLVPLNSLPVYVRRGALLPLALSPEKVPAFGESMPVMFEWFAPTAGSVAEASFVEPAAVGPGAVCKMSLGTDGGLSGSFSSHAGAGGFKIYGISQPEKVSIDAGSWSARAGCTYTHHLDVRNGGALTVQCRDLSNGVTFSATGVQPAF